LYFGEKLFPWEEGLDVCILVLLCHLGKDLAVWKEGVVVEDEARAEHEGVGFEKDLIEVGEGMTLPDIWWV